MVGDDFGMRVKYEKGELYDLVGAGGPGEPGDDGLDEECDVAGDGVVC